MTVQSHYQFFKTYPFEAARRLTALDARHPQARLHGHSFGLTVTTGPTDNLEDQVFAKLDQALYTLLPHLDYQYLNESTGLPHPNDAHLINWIWGKLPPFSAEAELRSTASTGVRLNRQGTFHFYQQFDLHSAHFLPHLPPTHKCHRLHGHNFKVILEWSASSLAKVLSYEEAAGHFIPVQKQLHRRLLNEIEGLENPTAENLAAWLWRHLKISIPALSSVTVYETPTAGTCYDGNLWDCFKTFTFDSALPASEQDIMGHTYDLRLHVRNQLDPHLGWTRDFGEFHTLLKPYYQQIDHHPLHEIETLPSPHMPRLADWIYHHLKPNLPELASIRLNDTEHTGMIAHFDGTQS